MARDEAYRLAEQKIEEARRSEAKELDLSRMKLTELPESLGQLTQLQTLELAGNQLTALPEWLGQLTQLETLNLSNNQLTALPEWLGQLTQLVKLSVHANRLTSLTASFAENSNLKKLYLGVSTDETNEFHSLPDCIVMLRKLEMLQVEELKLTCLPDWLSRLSELKRIWADGNDISEIPSSLCQLNYLDTLELGRNPLTPELAAAYKKGLTAVKRYLRAKAEAQVVLNEAKLILIGEGEVGKSCLLGALRGDEWVEGRDTTHGIEIKPVKVIDAATGTKITLNGWDFGGQRLFSFEPVEPGFFDRPKWMNAKFRLTLWCEHSRVPLWRVSGEENKGVYTIDLPREWLVKAAPFLKVLASTLGLMLPVVAATAKVALPEIDYKKIEGHLELGKAAAESLLKGGEKVGEWLAKDDDFDVATGRAIRAHGAVLRRLHALLKEKDPGFGGLVRVQNKRQEFLWVHPLFEKEY